MDLYRGTKSIDLKGIVDEALESCPGVKTVLVAKRINSEYFHETRSRSMVATFIR